MEFTSNDDILRNVVDPSLPIVAPDPVIIDTIPGIINFYDTEVPLQEYLDDAGEDACVFLYKGRLMGSSKDYIKNTLSTIGNNHGEGIFYECRAVINGTFSHSNILRQKYGRVALSSPFYFNLEAILPIFGSHKFWKISDEPVKRLIASASRSGAITGGPIASADHCQAGTSKDIHTLLPFIYTTVASVTPAVANSLTRMNNNSIKLRNVNTSMNTTYKITGPITVSELRKIYAAKHDNLGISDLINFIQNGKILKDDYIIKENSVILVQVVRDGLLYKKETLAEWRAKNPGATSIDMSGRDDIRDDECVHLRGLLEIDISECNNLTDAAFVHFRGVKTLIMNNCNQETITDAAFQHLTGIKTLSMSYCDQDTITDAAFIHLKGIEELYISCCNQITDAAFTYLDDLKLLDMTNCNQTTITDAAFTNLTGLRELIMDNCNQTTITDDAFANLNGIYSISMNDCNQETITDAAFENLLDIQILSMENCNQVGITGVFFKRLSPIERRINIEGCNEMTIKNYNDVFNPMSVGGRRRRVTRRRKRHNKQKAKSMKRKIVNRKKTKGR